MNSEGTAGRGIVGKALTWAISLVVFAGVLEVCVRIEDAVRWGGPLAGAYSFDALFGRDSIGWRPRPGAAYQKFSINGFGFRGPEITPDPQPGTTRVAVLGASESFGQAESPGNEYPRALEEALAAADESGRTFEVVNAAIPGMSVARMEEYWARWVSRFEPDVVVVYPSPGFYLGNEPPPDSVQTVRRGFSDPPGGLRILPRLRTVVRQFLPPAVSSMLKRRGIREVRDAHGPDWVWTDLPDERLEIYRRHLRSLARTLRDAGVQVYLATHVSAVSRPISGREHDILTGWQRFHPRAEPQVILDFEARANDELRDIAAQEGVGVIDLARAMPEGTAWFSDHQHFSDAGADTVAAILAEGVLTTLHRSPAVDRGD